MRPLKSAGYQIPSLMATVVRLRSMSVLTQTMPLAVRMPNRSVMARSLWEIFSPRVLDGLIDLELLDGGRVGGFEDIQAESSSSKALAASYPGACQVLDALTGLPDESGGDGAAGVFLIMAPTLRSVSTSICRSLPA